MLAPVLTPTRGTAPLAAFHLRRSPCVRKVHGAIAVSNCAQLSSVAYARDSEGTVLAVSDIFAAHPAMPVQQTRFRGLRPCAAKAL